MLFLTLKVLFGRSANEREQSKSLDAIRTNSELHNDILSNWRTMSKSELVTSLMKKYAIKHTVWKFNESTWNIAAGWVTEDNVLPENSPELGKLKIQIAVSF